MNLYGEIVIQLHDLARRIENEIGKGQLSDDLREIADRVNFLGKPLEVERNQENV